MFFTIFAKNIRSNILFTSRKAKTGCFTLFLCQTLCLSVYKSFRNIGVRIDEVMIRRITDVKNAPLNAPTERALCATISATSPRVIIPIPILRQSFPLKPHNLEVAPQPMIFDKRPTSTKHAENKRIDVSTALISV